jgi:hypothetical protein
MFILTTISDLVQIPPHEFHRADLEEITDKINEKYSNKIIQNIGLCIALYDLLSASDGLISYGTGNVNVNGELLWCLRYCDFALRGSEGEERMSAVNVSVCFARCS